MRAGYTPASAFEIELHALSSAHSNNDGNCCLFSYTISFRFRCVAQFTSVLFDSVLLCAVYAFNAK